MSIYKITNNENDFIYIGKTLKTIYHRLNEHEVDYGAWLHRGCRRSYISSFEILKHTGYKIEVLETVDDTSLLKEREKYYINHIQCVNIIHNHNTSSATFLCPCCKTVDSDKRFKHNKSQTHRRIIRTIHSNSKNRFYFIQMYKNSKIEEIPVVGGITLNIDC